MIGMLVSVVVASTVLCHLELQSRIHIELEQQLATYIKIAIGELEQLLKL